MKIIIYTQNDPFFLSDNLRYLIENLPKEVEIVGIILNNASPFGKRDNFFIKSLRTLSVFGINFFCYYSFKYLLNFLSKDKDIKKILRKYNLKLINLEKSVNDKSSISIINSYKPDLLISILGNEIFRSEIIKLPKYGIINLHSSLLPKYRGLMPAFWVLHNKEKYTGVSVFFVDEGIDSGPILEQEKIEINNSTHQELILKTKHVGMILIIKAIKKIIKGDYSLINNYSNDMSYFSFPTRKDVIHFLKIGNKFF